MNKINIFYSLICLSATCIITSGCGSDGAHDANSNNTPFEPNVSEAESTAEFVVPHSKTSTIAKNEDSTKTLLFNGLPEEFSPTTEWTAGRDQRMKDKIKREDFVWKQVNQKGPFLLGLIDDSGEFLTWPNAPKIDDLGRDRPYFRIISSQNTIPENRRADGTLVVPHNSIFE